MELQVRSTAASALALLIALATLQSCASLRTDCTSAGVFTVSAGADPSSMVLFREDCSSKNLVCDKLLGCVKYSPGGADDFICPTSTPPPAQPLQFSELGNCQRYIECSTSGVATTKPCDNQYYQPDLRTCVSESIFNLTARCYRGERSCTNSTMPAGHLYLESHPYDPRTYIACANGGVLYTGGCPTFFDPTSGKCV